MHNVGGKMIEVESKKYKVLENLGFQNGYYAKEVAADGDARIAVKRNGKWTWWTVADRLQTPSRYMPQ